MNMPLKLVDLVTLLFCSLLVVIIVFIILQRNIKRFKLRNFKDSHFLKCKSIPQDLRDAIEKKHIISDCYKEPPQLLGESHLNQPEENAKNYVLRMKAFEVSKSLENALAECGYFRNMSKKLENYINDDILDPSCDDNSLPKTLLNEFVDIYLWAMHDPVPFTKHNLRKLNQLVNKIITILAFNKTDKHDQIIQHKLDLDLAGDLDFNELFLSRKTRSYSNINQINASQTNILEKRKLTRLIQSKSTPMDGKADGMYEEISMDDLKDSKLKKPKIVKNASTKSKKLFQTKSSKYEEIKNASNSSAFLLRKSKQDLNDTGESQMNADWLLPNDRNFDSENEEIPLVSSKKTHQKKKSNLSNILVGSAPTKPSNKQQTPVTQTSVQRSASPSNSIRLSKISSNLKGNLQISNPTELGGMHENEGFNETIFY